jgi:Ser/Thr protein kinase RdoA (MazF antagonist)
MFLSEDHGHPSSPRPMTSADAFANLRRDAQLSRLRRAAFNAVAQYDLEVRHMRLLSQGRNVTFRVETIDGRRFALRLNVNSRSSPAHMRAEVAWMDALSRDTLIRVPCPELTAHKGERISFIRVEGLAEPRPVVLFSWLTGRHLQNVLSRAKISQMGALTATLHRHASAWAMPANASLPPARTVLLNSPLVLWGDSATAQPSLCEELRRLFRIAWERGEAALGRSWSQRSVPARPLHFDLHPWNLKWERQPSGGRLAVFDFDGSVLGHPVQDLAIALHYLRRSPDWTPAWDESLRAGYEGPGGGNGLAWPRKEQALEDLVAARAVLLANDVLQSCNPDVRAKIPAFLAGILPRLRAWQRTGRMDWRPLHARRSGRHS